MKPVNRRQQGQAYEDQAAEYLLGLGYSLVTRRYCIKGGEIDIVAMDGDEVVFVEVKARHSSDRVPEESIGPSKAAAMQKAAQKFLRENQITGPFRFDLVAFDSSELRHTIRLELSCHLRLSHN